MTKMCLNKSKFTIRTKHLSILVFVIALCTFETRAHIDFEDIETLWLKDATVQQLPATKNQRRNLLRISGLPTIDKDDDIQIMPTLSATQCNGNEPNLKIINELPIGISLNRTTELLVSLEDFHFRQHPAAYLCIKSKYEEFFQHMGIKSKFENLSSDQFSRDRRNPPFETTHSDNKCPLGEIRIDGIRIESADKEISYDDDAVPALISNTNARLRLFGCGFTEQTVITFTKQINDRNGACLLPASGQFRVQTDGLLEYTAVVDIVAPVADTTRYYLCIKNADDGQDEKKIDRALPFRHQGTESWVAINAHDLLLPIWLTLIIICGCLCFSALFSGLNLGLMSLDRTELKILRNTGLPKERKYAKQIQPVRDHGNFLLCSILLGNVLVNSTFTILLDGLTSGLVAVVCSTLLIVIFGEITPQAICSRHGLAVGAKTIIITKAIMVITFPLAYPVSKFLDCILGEEIGNVYNRERLKELVRVTKDVNDLDKDEVNIISGALELRKKTVKSVMTPISDAYMLSIDAILDFNTVTDIMRSGFSRIPVYEGERHNIVNLLYIKDLALVDTDDRTPLRTLCAFYENACFFVFEDVTLDVIFKDFKEGKKGHMAFVHRVNTEGDGDPFYETIGLVTLEDVIEEMIQAEIVDETDVYTDNRSKTKRKTADDRIKVYKVFKGDNQRIDISPQLALATFQYLNTAVEAFKSNQISKIILRHLLNQNVFRQLRIKGKEKFDKSLYLYEQGKPADYFILILEGRAEVMVGTEKLLFDAGPFTYYGTQALAENLGAIIQPNKSPEKSPNKSRSVSLQSLYNVSENAFIPDFSVRAMTDILFVIIKRSRYLAARRATIKLEEMNAGNTSNEPIDDEVKELLFSFDEGDGSESAHTTNLNAISPRASVTASPITAGNPENPVNGSAAHENHQNTSPTVSYVPGNHMVQIHSPEHESLETDALLTTAQS